MDQTTDIGSRLRQFREERALTLRDIATTTKISLTALAAIEHNDFGRLPGGVFRRAYRAGVRGRGGFERRRPRARDSRLNHQSDRFHVTKPTGRIVFVSLSGCRPCWSPSSAF